LFYKYIRILSWLFFLLTQTVSASSFPEPVISFQQAWFVDTQIDTPPTTNAPNWRQINLPDNWYNSHGSDEKPAWYRVDFMLEKVEDFWGVYLPAVNTNVVIWLDGKRVGDGGRMQDPAARNWHRPLYFSIGKHLLVQGKNSLYIQLLPKKSGYGFLGEIHIGPDNILRPVYEQLNFTKQTLIGISAVLLFSFGLFISLLWFKHRKDSMYGWFSAACFFWAFVALDMVVHHVPLQERLWDTLVFASVGWIVICTIIFMHRFWGEKHILFERFLLWFGSIGTVTLYFVGDENFYFFSSFIWDNLLISFSLYMAWFIFCHCMKKPSTEAWVLVAATAVAISFGGHDNLVQMGILDFDRPHFMPFGGVLLLGVILWMLIKQFVSTMDEMEKLNQDLDMRVQAKSRELVENYMFGKQAEQEKALAEERGRIMRDMHDGTGGHLVAALAQVEKGDFNKAVLSETLQSALDDIRLMIDSLDPVDEDIVTVLAMFRSRIEPRLRYSGISIRWQVQDVPAITGFGPEKVLQLMHILHEVVTNIIKHAQADLIIFRTGVHRSPSGKVQVYVEIEDNGKGFGDEQEYGRGIANMHYRAKEIRAKLKLLNSEHGVVVQLLFQTTAEKN